MNRRILIPVIDSNGDQISEHFGRAPFFAIISINAEGTILEKTVHPNTGEHSGGRGHAHDNVHRLNPNVIIVAGMGPRGIRSFQSQNIPVLRASTASIDELVTAYLNNQLDELTEGCSEAHHQ